MTRHYFGPAGQATNSDSHLGGDSSRGELDVADLSQEPNNLAQWGELHEQIGLLPDSERVVMDLLYYEGLSQADAAQILGVSVRTVQRRWHGALLLLHDKVGDDWPEF